MQQKKYIITALVCILISLSVGGLTQGFLSFEGLGKISQSFNDSLTYRLGYRLQHNLHQDEVVIVKIDDRALDMLGRSDLGMTAFDKGVYAQAIEILFEYYKASVVGVDVVFANPSVLGTSDEQKLQTVGERYRDRLVIATRSSGDPHPLCLYSDITQGYIDKKESEQIRRFEMSPKDYDIRSFCPDDTVLPAHSDGIESLSLELLKKYISQSDPFTRERLERALQIFAASDQHEFLIEYYSNGRSNDATLGYQSISLADILEKSTQTLAGEVIDLEGKIILIGEVGTLMHDAHFTPLSASRKVPGVEINAHILTTMMQGRLLEEVPILTQVLVFFVFQLVLIVSVMLLSIWLGLGVLVFSLGLISLYFGVYMYSEGNMFDVFFGSLWSILTFFSIYIYRFQVSDRAKRMLKKQFSRYVAPEVVQELSQDPDSVMLRGESRDMSIFFSDIVSFTTISEQTEAKQLLILLNEYFEAMSRIILRNSGTLDKYIGDAVMCFFGAPVPRKNHSFLACKTALEQQQILKKLNADWSARGYPEIKIRIGIHSGDAIHGNIGDSETRLSYTVIGDSVNLASRLEGICKHYGIYICVSEEVFTREQGSFYFRELDSIEVKGRAAPVTIYQLLAPKSVRLDERTLEYLNRYAQALSLYRAEKYSEAQAYFLKNTGDPPSAVMEKRCQDIRDGKAEVYQGVFRMLTK